MAIVTITPTKTTDGFKLVLTLPQGHTNDVLVRDVAQQLAELKAAGVVRGGTCYVNGPATVAMAYCYAHVLVHLFNVVAVFDPKLGNAPYVVVSAHGTDLKEGDTLPEPTAA